MPAGRRLLVLDGPVGRWLPPGWDVLPQATGGLDRRLAAAFAAATPGAPALLVGMDTPQLDAGLLAAALSPARRAGVDAWYGPAEDGGFWALGLARPDAELARRLLVGVPMSTPDTGRALLDRLAAAGLTVHHLPAATDVDTIRDARLVAAQAPHGRFAARLRAVEGDHAADGSRAMESSRAVAGDRATESDPVPEGSRAMEGDRATANSREVNR
ncbi:DUF2064 domain-containing protein [Kitasatospora sp. MMS16-BH015]|uniref:DUF2064 domain-containing protein n=1 Tax=Kitasatospora sp. MMS16-BH015 TaxID=2018025 RepID=UPI0020C4D1A5|nr:DUF2064 domain-containing protein [Kitasatospora sp. MMS16-BH015]